MVTITLRLAAILFLATASTAQSQTIYDVRDLLADKDGRWPAQTQGRDERNKVLGELAGAALRRQHEDCSVNWEPGYIVVRAGKNEQSGFETALMDLRRGEAQRVLLQVSLIHLPATLAAANGLADGNSKDVTPDQVAVLLRQVQAAHGTLANLPEVRTRTLQAFEMPVPAGRAPTPGEERKSKLMVRGQVLPVGQVAAVRLDLFDPDAKQEKVSATSVSPFVLAVEVGKGVLLTRVQGGQAFLLWVQVTAASAEADGGKAKGE